MTDDKVPVWIQRVARRYCALNAACLGTVLLLSVALCVLLFAGVIIGSIQATP